MQSAHKMDIDIDIEQEGSCYFVILKALVKFYWTSPMVWYVEWSPHRRKVWRSNLVWARRTKILFSTFNSSYIVYDAGFISKLIKICWHLCTYNDIRYFAKSMHEDLRRCQPFYEFFFWHNVKLVFSSFSVICYFMCLSVVSCSQDIRNNYLSKFQTILQKISMVGFKVAMWL